MASAQHCSYNTATCAGYCNAASWHGTAPQVDGGGSGSGCGGGGGWRGRGRLLSSDGGRERGRGGRRQRRRGRRRGARQRRRRRRPRHIVGEPREVAGAGRARRGAVQDGRAQRGGRRRGRRQRGEAVALAAVREHLRRRQRAGSGRCATCCTACTDLYACQIALSGHRKSCLIIIVGMTS